MDADDMSEIDWSKIAMGVAVAIVFVMQQYHAMKLEDVKSSVVSRHEIEDKTDNLMNKDDIMQALSAINNRLDAMEKK